MKKTLETTPIIRKINERLNDLNNALPKILNQKIWQQKVLLSEKIEFLRQLSDTKSALWLEAEKAYPELKGQSYSVGNSSITYENN